MAIEVGDIVYSYIHGKNFKILDIRKIDLRLILENPAEDFITQYRIKNDNLPFYYRWFSRKRTIYFEEKSRGIWISAGDCRLFKKANKYIAFNNECEYYSWLSKRLD